MSLLPLLATDTVAFLTCLRLAVLLVRTDLSQSVLPEGLTDLVDLSASALPLAPEVGDDVESLSFLLVVPLLLLDRTEVPLIPCPTDLTDVEGPSFCAPSLALERAGGVAFCLFFLVTELVVPLACFLLETEGV